jgi:hypothetical protein
LAGDAILVVTGVERINYYIMGNSDPVLHAYIVPRFASEPETLRKGLPWPHPDPFDPSTAFYALRDRELIEVLLVEIQSRLNKHIRN